MQKKILAAVVGSMIAGQAMAITVVDDGTNKLTIGGHVGIRYVYDKNDDQPKHSTRGDSSRINFALESNVMQDTTAFAKVEWGFNTTYSGGSNDQENLHHLWNRLGYVGVKNDQMGSISFGRQWSSYALVAGYTDMYATANGGYANGFYGNFDDVLGTGMADDALQYNGSFEGLNISAQLQVGHRTFSSGANVMMFGGIPNVVNNDRLRKSSYGIAASYDLPMGLSFGLAYNIANIKNDGGTFNVAVPPMPQQHPLEYKAKSLVGGVKYEEGPIYVAITYADLRNRDLAMYTMSRSSFVEKARGLEIYGSYQVDDSIKLEGGYSQLKEKSNGIYSNDKMKKFPFGVVYTAGPIQLSGTYVFDKSKNQAGEKRKDYAILQARYYF